MSYGKWGYAGQVCCQDCGAWMMISSAFYDKITNKWCCLYDAKKRGLKTGMD